ncbi:MAG: hypothetical protein ACOVSW_08425 [Candidatus Kapaibacteriota bacterium]
MPRSNEFRIFLYALCAASVLALQSCAIGSVTRLTVSCPRESTAGRLQYLEQLCQKAGMERTDIFIQTDIQRLEARKRITPYPSERNAQGLFTFDGHETYREFAWVMYLHRDSVIAFASYREVSEHSISSIEYYTDTTSLYADWYWTVRHGLDSLCGAPVTIVRQTIERSRADEYYRDLCDTLITSFRPLAEVFQTLRPDTTAKTAAVTESLDNRIAFDEGIGRRTVWELDRDLVRDLRLMESRVPFDMMRLYQAGLDSVILETRVLGLESTRKRFLLNAAHAKAIQSSIAKSLDRDEYWGKDYVSEQMMTLREVQWQGEAIIDLYAIQGLTALITPEPLPRFNPNNPTSFFANYQDQQIRRTLTGFGALIGGGALTLWSALSPWYVRTSSLMLMDAATWAVPQGMALYGIFADEAEPNIAGMYTMGVFTALARGFLTARLPESLRLNYAQTQTVLAGGSSGTMLGLLIPTALGAFASAFPPQAASGLPPVVQNEPLSLRTFSISTLLGSALGYGLGYALATNVERPLVGGNGYVLDAIGKFGLLMPWIAGITLSGGILSAENMQQMAIASILGQIGGYGLGAALLGGHDFTYQQERNIRSAAGLGAIVPFLAGYLFTRSNPDPSTLPLILSASGIGWSLGMAIGLIGESGAAKENFRFYNEDRKFWTLADNAADSWWSSLASRTQIEFSPLGLASLVLPARMSFGLHIPMVQMQVKL